MLSVVRCSCILRRNDLWCDDFDAILTSAFIIWLIMRIHTLNLNNLVIVITWECQYVTLLECRTSLLTCLARISYCFRHSNKKLGGENVGEGAHLYSHVVRLGRFLTYRIDFWSQYVLITVMQEWSWLVSKLAIRLRERRPGVKHSFKFSIKFGEVERVCLCLNKCA